MSSANPQRAGRSSKDRPKQPSHSTAKTPTEGQKTTTSDSVVTKIQPTAEQMRIAQIIYDANKSELPDLKDKIEKIIEITGRTKDDALVALHDCDNDSNRATIMLLEGNEDEGKWETSGKKKKNRQSQQKAPEVNGHEPAPAEKEEKEPVVENTNRRREPKQRDGGFRYRGPPRMNRGGNQNRNWRNKENEKNERNLQENRRERNNDGREGRNIRGPRKNFSGRGRGRGGRSRTFQNRGLQNNDGFPESIDTWNNSTAEKVNMPNTADTTMTVGNWSDVAVTEEWSEEDWTENLNETKVFTPSAGTQSSAVTGLDMPTATALGQNIDLSSFLQKPSTNAEQSSSMSSSNGPSVGQPSLLSQQMQQNVAPQSQSHFDFNQFAKQAEAQIKAAVGVVSTPAASSLNTNSFQASSASYPSSYSVNSSSSQHHVQLPPELQQVIVSQSNYSSTSSPAVHMPSRDLHSPVASQQSMSMSTTKATTSQHQAPLPQRVKPPPKARLPPPSKIPESAVVMPDDAVASLDVQFGALQFGTDSSPFDFTASDNSNSYQDIGQSSSGSSHVNSQQAMPSNITSQAYSNALPSSVTMSKESTYSMGSHASPSQNSMASELTQSQKVSNQESLLLSQSEHKNVDSVSSFVNHRSSAASNLETLNTTSLNVSPGSMISNKSDQSSLNSFNTSTHDSASAYSSYSNQKSVLNSSNHVPSTVSYSASMNSGCSDISSNQSSQPKYQGQVASQSQNASSYVSGSSSSYGLQQAPYSQSVTTTASSYSSQTGYSSHSSGYGANSSGYSSQQNVYSGSATTTAQSGSMISTSVSTSKLTNSLNHKDSSLLDSQHNSTQLSYDVPSTTSVSNALSVSSLAQTSSVNHSVQNSSNMTSVLGLVSTSSSTTTTSVLKNSLSATGKAVPNIPQNMPAAMLGHQYIMGQSSFPFYGLQQPVYSYEEMQMLQSKINSMGLQSPVYSYEDLQMVQSKLSTLGYYDMPQFQAPTSMTGREPGMSSVAYTADGKYSRADTDASTVATTLSQGQANTQTHGQAFLNPAAALPPGYGYYFAGGMMGGIHHYAAAPPIFPVPPATNTHGATTNTQFQKANAYGSHSYNSGYDSLSQQQDYTKGTYGAASQNQVKGVSGSGAVPDLSGSVYSKTHAAQLAKSYDKPGFHTGTPPPFNLAGSQAAGPLGASSGPYATQFIPVLAHGQHHSTALLHHHMQQDTTQAGGTPAAGQRGPQGLSQQKNSAKQSYAYWTTN